MFWGQGASDFGAFCPEKTYLWPVENLFGAPSSGAGVDAAATTRTYRVVVCAKGSLETEVFHKLSFLAESDLMWSTIPDELITEYLNALAFKTLSAAGAKTELEIASVHKRYPYRAFLLIHDPDVAREMINEPNCIGDPFWRQFKIDNPDLTSRETRARLILMALLLIPSIVRIEALHASIRQILRQGSTTHISSFLDASSSFLIKRLRTREKKLIVPREPIVVPNATVHDPTPLQCKQKSRRGGGGAWRAFISTTDVGLTKDFSKLAMQYSQISNDERARLKALGKEGTRRHREDPSSRRFGPTARDTIRGAERSRKRSLTDALVQPLQDGDGPIRSSDVASQVVAKSASWHDAENNAKHAKRALGDLRAQEAARGNSSIIEFVQSTGQERLAAMRSAVPSAHLALHRCVPQPSSKDWPLFTYDHGTSCRAANALACVVCQRDRLGHSIGKLVEVEAHRRHWMIFHDECDPVPEETKAEKKANRCWHAGMCLCSEEGKKLFRFKNTLLNFIKIAAYDEYSKSSVVDGDWFIALNGADSLDDAPMYDDGTVYKHAEFVWHIASLSLNPFVPTFQRMLPTEFIVGDAVEADFAQPCVRLRLEAVGGGAGGGGMRALLRQRV